MAYRLRPIDLPVAAGPAGDRSAESSARSLIRRAWQWIGKGLERALEFRPSMERYELARRFKRG